jgi:hypothetical protein
MVTDQARIGLTLVLWPATTIECLTTVDFMNTPPNCPSFDGIAFSAIARFRSGPHSPPIDSIFGSDGWAKTPR